eukprot:scaffold11617_cov130-Isochrysis_galbana.AAC.1
MRAATHVACVACTTHALRHTANTPTHRIKNLLSGALHAGAGARPETTKVGGLDVPSAIRGSPPRMKTLCRKAGDAVAPLQVRVWSHRVEHRAEHLVARTGTGGGIRFCGTHARLILESLLCGALRVLSADVAQRPLFRPAGALLVDGCL